MSSEISCPICDADIPLDGDERAGDTVLCSFCGASSALLKVPSKDDDTYEFEEE